MWKALDMIRHGLPSIGMVVPTNHPTIAIIIKEKREIRETSSFGSTMEYTIHGQTHMTSVIFVGADHAWHSPHSQRLMIDGQ